MAEFSNVQEYSTNVDPVRQSIHASVVESVHSQRQSLIKNRKQPGIIYLLAVTATFGAMLTGYDSGVVNGALILINEHYKLSVVYREWIVASTVAAAAVSSFVSGVMADAIGRKTTIVISAVIFAVGGVLMGVAPNPILIIVGRSVVGISIGLVSSVAPVYLSECAPAEIRGQLVTLNQLFMTIGIVLSAVAAGALQGFGEIGWRLMLGLSVIPAVIQLILFFGLPESPRYMMMKSQEEKAERTLKRIRGRDDVTAELTDIRLSVEQEKNTKGLVIWKKIFKTPHIRKALFIGCMLQFFQQFCGINIVIYYSATILKSAGFDSRMAIWLSVIPATVNFLATFIGLWAVETMGRKLILAFSFLAIALSLVVLCASFLLQETNSPAALLKNEPGINNSVCGTYQTCFDCSTDDRCGYCFISGDQVTNGACVLANANNSLYADEGRCVKADDKDAFAKDIKDLTYTYSFCPSEYALWAVAGLMLFVLGFAPGAGPMPWTINAEIYPQWARSVANSLATVANYTCNVAVSSTFITLTQLLSAWGTFLMFGVICVIAFFFVLIFVPETKNKTLEEIEQLFMSKAKRQEAEKHKSIQPSSLETKNSENQMQAEKTAEITVEAPSEPPRSSFLRLSKH